MPCHLQNQINKHPFPLQHPQESVLSASQEQCIMGLSTAVILKEMDLVHKGRVKERKTNM